MDPDRLRFVVTSSVLIVALTALALIFIHFAGRRVLARIVSLRRVGDARRRQLVTVYQIVRWVLVVLLVGSAVLMLLATFGVDITPLLASIGVAGLALSLGAQTLIKDLIGGVLIVVENQFAVGDVIQVGTVSGQVERITLRATHVREASGTLQTVPNGEIRVLGNQTKGWSGVVVDVGVAYEEDLDRALQVLAAAAREFSEDPVLGSALLEPPEVVGPVSLGDWAVTVRLRAKTQPGKQWETARELRKHALAACERQGISLPYPRQEVWVRSLDGGGPDSVSHD
jgi:small conductance mechanosensitive channel